MRNTITVDDIANNIRMLRTQFSGCFMILEGDTDLLFYQKLVDESKSFPISAYSKNNVIETLVILQQGNFEGVIGIVDSDFSILEGNQTNNNDLLYTDNHDLEIFLLISPALEKVLFEFGSKGKITRIGRSNLRSILVESGKYLGYLRWLSTIKNYNFRFEDLPFRKFIDENTLSLELENLIRVVLDHSQRQDLAIEIIRDEIKDLWDNSHNPWDICCGHDLICIFSFGLRKMFGTNNANEVKPKIIERSMRLAYEESFFQETKLYNSLKEWEAENNPFSIFK